MKSLDSKQSYLVHCLHGFLRKISVIVFVINMLETLSESHGFPSRWSRVRSPSPAPHTSVAPFHTCNSCILRALAAKTLAKPLLLRYLCTLLATHINLMYSQAHTKKPAWYVAC